MIRDILQRRMSCNITISEHADDERAESFEANWPAAWRRMNPRSVIAMLSRVSKLQTAELLLGARSGVRSVSVVRRFDFQKG